MQMKLQCYHLTVKAEYSLPFFLFCSICLLNHEIYSSLSHHLSSDGFRQAYSGEQTVVMVWINKVWCPAAACKLLKSAQLFSQKNIYCIVFYFVSSLANGSRNSGSIFILCSPDSSNKENTLPLSQASSLFPLIFTSLFFCLI